MKLKKTVFNFNIEDVIKSNLSLQTINRVLQSEFGFRNTNFDFLIDKSLKHYPVWSQEKKDKFISTIGGRANFKKTKAYIEARLEEPK